MQDQFQAQLQEQLVKVQQEMKDQILESQISMVNQLAQLLAGEREKGKGTAVNSGNDNEDPIYPSGFTLVNVQAQPDAYLQRAPITIIPQQYQVDASAPSNYQTGSGSNPEVKQTNPVVPDPDDVAETKKERAELPKQIEDRCRWLEEKLRAMENVDCHGRIDAMDLSLVPDLVLRQRYVNNDQLLIHCFQDSLIGSAAKWYNQLSHARVNSWKDLAQAFMKHYSHVTDMTPDRLTLQNIEKKQNESFRQYAQRWREVATQVQPPLLEKETMMLFIYTLNAPFFNHMLGSAKKSFSDIVMSGEMIKNAVKSGKIDTGEISKRFAPRKKESEVNNVGVYNKGYLNPITVGPTKTKIVERLIEMGVVKFDDQSSAENSLPNYTDEGVNAIVENAERKTKMNTAEIKTPMREECNEFGALVQGLMDNKELKFFEYVEEAEVCASEEGSTKRVCEANCPVVIISRPRSSEAGV
ncbi:dynactin subunit 1-like [Gossypium australe]|uniref:Dynactin subunit 1-like n=1 Tax=Gossypium australe TaxID=47621 RepID=A0A5B6V6Y2_9ROSI|nr:dynactin subunit 1-like [Gossypium australe]